MAKKEKINTSIINSECVDVAVVERGDVSVDTPTPPDGIDVRGLPIIEVMQTSASSSIPIDRLEDSGSYDVRASGGVVVRAKSFAFVPISIAMKIPKGIGCLVFNKASAAEKKMVTIISPQVIDCYDNSDVSLLMFNAGVSDAWVNTGDTVATFVFFKSERVDFVTKEEIEEQWPEDK
jgi:dUTPase